MARPRFFPPVEPASASPLSVFHPGRGGSAAEGKLRQAASNPKWRCHPRHSICHPPPGIAWFLAIVLTGLTAVFAPAGATPAPAATTPPPLELKAWGVPDGGGSGADGEASMKILMAFQARHPDLKLVPATGLEIPGRSQDVIPLMQIAGDIAPAVMYVNFRQSDTFIRNKFLHPLDKYLEKTAGVTIPDGHLLATDAYVAALSLGPRYAGEFAERLTPQCWEVIRRDCPHGQDCPYVKTWGGTPAAKHRHVWCLPQRQLVMALFYRRDLFAEAGLPDRVPETTEEFLAWARKLTHPEENVYGAYISLAETAHATLSFLYSFGAHAVEQDAQGNWHCVFNSPEAVDAYYYVARLFLEPFKNAHGRFTGVVNLGEKNPAIRYAMRFAYVDQQTFKEMDPNVTGFGPVPAGPDGRRHSEFNAMMTGIYAGIETDVRLRDAAWEWMFFLGSREARTIQARVYIENGMGRFVQPALLQEAGYPEFIGKVPAGWAEASRTALVNGIPEPYGRNCQMVYQYMSRAIDQIRTDAEVSRAILAGDEAGAKARIREILDARVEFANRKMLGVMPESIRTFRTRLAAAAAILIFGVFILVLRSVFRTFTQSMLRSEADLARGNWQFGRYRRAYLILIPSLLSIAIWSYWPLLRGTVMAFQEYNVRGFSTWVAFDNFAAVLFSGEFWYALLVSLEYTTLFMTFGFLAPVILALLLSEVPRGKILFRTIYYLPAVLSGVVVIFLWKGFYGQHGMINQMLNFGVHAFNAFADTHISEFTTEWLNAPAFSLFFCLLPTIWAGMGPGCLIYLAALKGIPEDLYEAADLDGAGCVQKAWYVTLPSIRPLIVINFVGAVIGCMKSGSEFIMAMTGGGPYTPYGATEVIGLHIFWEAFGYLRFGVATAMAWVLGVMLIGFTVLQLKNLSRMEFKAAGGK